ncbi:hypothetical protein EZH22_07080 [Xanthobacter dioxanivorans]|uniref:Uncharacterized protein n=1 Tax=Xanthobacter dioxanivorans TaxID=2528964 RepID=A0A974SL20_9HYPH|nr:hypothetical protein [Xanthobacter dioxanivorans]QRG08093.1 hypothetical protein EZH22_07080 [Xanthobacter dioxanivorans]
MRTLRAQVTAILVVAVLVVIALANSASFFLSRPPELPFGGIGAIARHVAETADLAAAVPAGTPAPGLSTAPRPARSPRSPPAASRRPSPRTAGAFGCAWCIPRAAARW